jgi:hypothetical protein
MMPTAQEFERGLSMIWKGHCLNLPGQESVQTSGGNNRAPPDAAS